MNVAIQSILSKKTWDDFILQFSPSALFQSWLWGEVQEKMGQKLWRFGMYEGKALVGVFQVLKVSARRGTFLHVRHGPIFIRQEKKYWEEFLRFIKELAKKEGAWFVRISPMIDNSFGNQAMLKGFGMIPAAIHAMDGEYCWVLDLNKSEEELLSGMRKTTRYEIKHAQHQGVRIAQSHDIADLKDFMALYKKTAQRHGFVEHRGIKEEFSIFSKEGKAVLFQGFFQEQSVSGAIILFVYNQAIYHHSASVPVAAGVNYLLQWEVIKEAKKRGMKVYNFWGIAPEDNRKHPWRGITLFKKGFGGREITYIHAHDLPVSSWYFIPRTIESIRKIRKGY